MSNVTKVQLFQELMDYETKGVSLWMDDCPSTPVEIANSDVLKEDASYMRDYVSNEKGVIEQIRFNRISVK